MLFYRGQAVLTRTEQLSALLNSTSDKHSTLTGRELISQKVSELVVMGGAYPSGREWNFFGSDPSLTAHAINSWEGRVVFVGDEVGRDVLSGREFMSHGPETDPVRQAYIYYSYFSPRPSWDALAVLYALHGLGELFEFGNEGGYGYNHVESDGTNQWVWDETRRDQKYLRLKVSNVTAAAEIDRLLLKGARSVDTRVTQIEPGPGVEWREL